MIEGTITEIESDIESIRKTGLSYLSNLTKAVFPNAKSIENSGLKDCTSLVELYAPNLSTLEMNALMGCKALKSLCLPAVETIKSGAFSTCSGLEIVDLPMVSHIESQAFMNCSSLVALILRRNTGNICSLGDKQYTLYGTPIASGTGYIYVPKSRLSTYQMGTNWNNYGLQFRALEDYTVDGTITGELDKNKI